MMSLSGLICLLIHNVIPFGHWCGVEIRDRNSMIFGITFHNPASRFTLKESFELLIMKECQVVHNGMSICLLIRIPSLNQFQ